MPSLKIEVVDENLLKNDIEGCGYIDLEDAIRQQNQWAINGYLLLGG